MKNLHLLTLLAFAFAFQAQAVVPHRIIVPDLPDYKTLKGDFHIHTVFSDATVWPTTRVDEAVMDGLDVIAITDHVEPRLQKQKLAGLFTADRNESYKIAAKAGKAANLLVIQGGEITRAMAPGHFNSLFDTDCEAIAEAATACGKDEMKASQAALREAHKQGAFTYWNHPHWERQAINGPVWHPEHTTLYQEGLMQGIEVFNSCSGFSPEAYGWALDRNLTLLSGTDCHRPLFQDIDYQHGQLRPVTLVFAKDRTLEGVRDALDHQRTAVLANGMVYGRENMLLPLFHALFQITDIRFDNTKVYLKISNQSSIPLNLTKGSDNEKLNYPRNFTIKPFEECNLTIHNIPIDATSLKKGFDVNLVVANFWIGVNQGLPYQLHLTIPQK